MVFKFLENCGHKIPSLFGDVGLYLGDYDIGKQKLYVRALELSEAQQDLVAQASP